MSDQYEDQVVFRKGEKVCLRPLEDGDLPKLVIQINNPETNVFLSVTHPMNLAQEKEWFERINKDESKVTLGIVLVKSDQLIGTIGLHDIDHLNGTASIGCALQEEYCHHGLGREACELMLDYAFNTLNLRKINSCAFDFNKASIATQKKLGFQKEGCSKKQIFRNGGYHDMVHFALFREDF